MHTSFHLSRYRRVYFFINLPKCPTAHHAHSQGVHIHAPDLSGTLCKRERVSRHRRRGSRGAEATAKRVGLLVLALPLLLGVGPPGERAQLCLLRWSRHVSAAGILPI